MGSYHAVDLPLCATVLQHRFCSLTARQWFAYVLSFRYWCCCCLTSQQHEAVAATATAAAAATDDDSSCIICPSLSQTLCSIASKSIKQFLLRHFRLLLEKSTLVKTDDWQAHVVLHTWFFWPVRASLYISAQHVGKPLSSGQRAIPSTMFTRRSYFAYRAHE